MDKIKVSKKDFDELYEIVDIEDKPKVASKDFLTGNITEEYATDTSEIKEEKLLSDEEQSQDDQLEASLEWETEE